MKAESPSQIVVRNCKVVIDMMLLETYPQAISMYVSPPWGFRAMICTYIYTMVYTYVIHIYMLNSLIIRVAAISEGHSVNGSELEFEAVTISYRALSLNSWH